MPERETGRAWRSSLAGTRVTICKIFVMQIAATVRLAHQTSLSSIIKLATTKIMVPSPEMRKLRAFHNNAQLKADMLREIGAHEKADQIEQGTYGRGKNGNWKGCAVACSVRSLAITKGEKVKGVEDFGQHERYETDLGIPEAIARLEDTLF